VFDRRIALRYASRWAISPAGAVEEGPARLQDGELALAPSVAHPLVLGSRRNHAELGQYPDVVGQLLILHRQPVTREFGRTSPFDHAQGWIR
jgi:hypothetical protein